MKLINQPTDGSGKISKTLDDNHVETIIDLVNIRMEVNTLFHKI